MQFSPFIADLPQSSFFKDEAASFQRAQSNFPDWLARGYYRPASGLAYYFIKIEERNFAPSYGLCGLVQTAEFSGDGVIRPHEAILKAREARQRAAYLNDSHLIKPVLLTCPPFVQLGAALRELESILEPVVYYEEEVIRVSVYVVDHQDQIDTLENLMNKVPQPIAVADGHHRISTAKKLALETDYHGSLAKIPVVLLPFDALRIDSYLRSISAPEKSEAEVLTQLAVFFDITEVEKLHRPIKPGDWLLTKGADRYRLTNRSGHFLPDSVWFDQQVLPQVFGITDSTADERLGTIPAEEGIEQVLELANSKPADWHFLPPPVTAAAFIRFIREKKIFPPKSTRFLPRLPSGLITYRLRSGKP